MNAKVKQDYSEIKESIEKRREEEEKKKEEEAKKKEEAREKFLALCRSKMNKAFLDLYEAHLAEALKPKPVVLERPKLCSSIENDLDDDFFSMGDDDN